MKKRSDILFIALGVFALAALMVYAVVRTALYQVARYRGGDNILAAALIAGEIFVLIHGFGYTTHIINVFMARRREPRRVKLAAEPPVAILVAARHEPRQVLEETFITLTNIAYANKRIYFLDDSSEERYTIEAMELAKAYGLTLFRRERRRGAKAGIINDCLETLTEKYIAVFDADANPLPQFLNDVVPIIEADARLAFVQTPQFYSNIGANPVARGAAFQQAVFYEYICEGKSVDESMFCCGTNVIFRREALIDVGGLDETTVTEDFATSVKLHAKKWKSCYYSHVNTFSMGPVSLGGYFTQQFRWASGTIAVFKRVIGAFVRNPFAMTFSQWWEYFLSGTYYLIGIAFFILMICPAAYLLFRVPSFFARKEIYLMAFLPYLAFSMSVFFLVLKDRHYRPKDLFLGQLLGFISFPVYIRAAACALLGVRTTFGVTQKMKEAALPYRRLWPQLGLIYINVVAICWGANRYLYEREPAIIVNAFWALYTAVTLSSIFYFNKERA